MILRRIFKTKETDRKVDQILQGVSDDAQGLAKSAKRLEKLLKADGVTLQIVIATGGAHRKR